MDIDNNIRSIKAKLPSSVRLVAVSKFHPIESILEAYNAGQRVFAESRPQELYSKVCAIRELQTAEVENANAECALRELQVYENMVSNPPFGDIEWHFIGHLQTNKLKMVLPFVSLVQSVDSVRLLEAIDLWGQENGGVTDVLLECHIASEASKQGFSCEEVMSVLSDCGRYRNVRFCGLMGMATFTDDHSVIRSDFAKIKSIFDSVLALKKVDPDVFRELSIGMSDDYLIAIEYGATMVRIGTDIFGPRP